MSTGTTSETSSVAARQETLAVFVQAIMQYFDRITGIPAETETPYLQEGNSELFDVTAVIGISGDVQGSVYYSAPVATLNQLLEFVGEHTPNDELRCDMAGEVANTLAGNARKRLGSGFMISVPVILQGRPERLAPSKGSTSFVIPIIWKEVRSFLVISLVEATYSFGI